MSKINTKCALIVSSLLLAISAAPSTFAQALKTITGPTIQANPIGILPPPPLPIPTTLPPSPLPLLDSSLYTTYTISNSYSYLSWLVCGSARETEGCYGSGNLGPFGKIGAMLSDSETTDYSTGTVTQNIYVVDEASDGGTGVTLYVYQKKDVITSSSDTVTTTPIGAIGLDLTGGINANTYMAGNDKCLFVGTDQSPHVLKIQKSNSNLQELGGFSPPLNVSSITTDRYGYVSVTFGNSSGNSAFIGFDPSCNGAGDGGGSDFMLNTTNGISTGSGHIVPAAVLPNYAARLQVHPKLQTTPQVIH